MAEKGYELDGYVSHDVMWSRTTEQRGKKTLKQPKQEW